MSEINCFKDVAEEVNNRFKNSNLGKLAKINEMNLYNYDAPIQELNPPIKNKQDGLKREREVVEELKEKYPEKE